MKDNCMLKNVFVWIGFFLFVLPVSASNAISSDRNRQGIMGASSSGGGGIFGPRIKNAALSHLLELLKSGTSSYQQIPLSTLISVLRKVEVDSVDEPLFLLDFESNLPERKDAIWMIKNHPVTKTKKGILVRREKLDHPPQLSSIKVLASRPAHDPEYRSLVRIGIHEAIQIANVTEMISEGDDNDTLSSEIASLVPSLTLQSSQEEQGLDFVPVKGPWNGKWVTGLSSKNEWIQGQGLLESGTGKLYLIRTVAVDTDWFGSVTKVRNEVWDGETGALIHQVESPPAMTVFASNNFGILRITYEDKGFLERGCREVFYIAFSNHSSSDLTSQLCPYVDGTKKKRTSIVDYDHQNKLLTIYEEERKYTTRSRYFSWFNLVTFPLDRPEDRDIIRPVDPRDYSSQIRLTSFNRNHYKVLKWFQSSFFLDVYSRATRKKIISYEIPLRREYKKGAGGAWKQAYSAIFSESLDRFGYFRYRREGEIEVRDAFHSWDRINGTSKVYKLPQKSEWTAWGLHHFIVTRTGKEIYRTEGRFQRPGADRFEVSKARLD